MRPFPRKRNQIIDISWLRMNALVDDNDCWAWLGRRCRLGYGRLYFSGSMKLVHRISYTLANGEIPVGTEIDHLCRNTSCFNPAHLEAVTHAENIRRGRSLKNVGGTCGRCGSCDLAISSSGHTRCRSCLRRRYAEDETYRALRLKHMSKQHAKRKSAKEAA